MPRFCFRERLYQFLKIAEQHYSGRFKVRGRRTYLHSHISGPCTLEIPENAAIDPVYRDLGPVTAAVVVILKAAITAFNA